MRVCFVFDLQKKGNVQRLVYSHGNREPFDESIDVQKDQYRMSFVLSDLRENTTYNVSLFGKNKYGDGKVANFQFCTASGMYSITIFFLTFTFCSYIIVIYKTLYP